MFMWLLMDKQSLKNLYTWHSCTWLVSFVKRLVWLFQTKQGAWGVEFFCTISYAQTNLSIPSETKERAGSEMSDRHAHIQEIFNSIQGEGIFIGLRQVFLRFCGCNLNCSYCDTPETQIADSGRCRVWQGCEPEEGFEKPTELSENTIKRYKKTVDNTNRLKFSKGFLTLENPLGVDIVADVIKEFWSPATKHVSLTGGEPLLQSRFIRRLAEVIDLPLYLETNSTLPDAASDVAGLIDVAACDIKLEESGMEDDCDLLRDKTLRTIEIFNNNNCSVFVKIIILPQTTSATLISAIKSIAEINPEIPLVLQPITPPRNQSERPSPKNITEMMDAASRYLRDVRIIPQTHRLLGVL